MFFDNTAIIGFTVLMFILHLLIRLFQKIISQLISSLCERKGAWNKNRSEQNRTEHENNTWLNCTKRWALWQYDWMRFDFIWKDVCNICICGNVYLHKFTWKYTVSEYLSHLTFIFSSMQICSNSIFVHQART